MNVERFLASHHIWYESMEHDPTYTAMTLADEVATLERTVAKSVLVRLEDGFGLIVVPAPESVDLRLVEEILGQEDVMLASEADCGHEFLDCEFGARLPFGSQYGLPTIMDPSLLDDEEVIFEGNTHRQAIRMKVDDYLDLEQPTIASVIQ